MLKLLRYGTFIGLIIVYQYIIAMETAVEKSNGFKKYWTLILAMLTSVIANATPDGMTESHSWYSNWWVWLILAVVAIWLFSRRRTPRHP